MRPMAWAKRFGGPGTSFSSNRRRGTATLVANQAEWAQLGPGERTGEEPVDERDEQPALTGCRELSDGEHQDSAGYDPRSQPR